MTGPERRQHPRTTLETFAYINLGASNYGSVLNISETGLSFRSVAPVQRNRTVRFWFSEHSHRIEAVGEVAWTDETQKTGGLRFTTLSAEAREQIQHWISHPTQLAVQESLALPGTVGVPNTAALTASRKLKVKVQLSGFSGGLAIGLMIAALVAAGFVFQNYRRQFGESLIRMGQRFAAQPQVHSEFQSVLVPLVSHVVDKLPRLQSARVAEIVEWNIHGGASIGELVQIGGR